MYNEIALKILLSISAIAHINAHPTSQKWTIVQDWKEVQPSKYQFIATSEKIISDCGKNPSGYLDFPIIVHGGQELRINGIVIRAAGTSDLTRASGYYSRITISCKEVSLATSLEWRAWSFSRYYARFNYGPRVRSGYDWRLFSGKVSDVVFGGTLIFLGLIGFVLFQGKVKNQLSYSYLATNLAYGFYFILSNSESYGISISVLNAHKFGLICLWIGVFCFFLTCYFQNIMSSKMLWFVAYVITFGLLLTTIGTTSDGIQLGTNLIFGPGIIAAISNMYIVWKRTVETRRTARGYLQFASMLAYTICACNDIFFILGVLDTPPIFSWGIVLGQFFLTFAVNSYIVDTYNERDHLRENLQLEVERKTSELKMAQAELIQSAKMASLGTLSAGLAHEINNAVNYVNGALAPLEKLVLKNDDLEKNKDKIQKLFAVMRDGLQLTVEIIKSLRNYSGLNQAQHNDIKIKEVFESVLTILRNKLRDRIRVNLQISDNSFVYGSVVGLNQVFMNLVSNAIDAMPNGGSLDITEEPDNDYLTLKIKDSGTGIPAAIKERIFDPFFTTKDVGKGTGLGLYIVKKEIERHFGTVEIDSAPGQGTTFTIRLPIKKMERLAA